MMQIQLHGKTVGNKLEVNKKYRLNKEIINKICEKFVKMLHELKIIICENVTSFILIFSQKVLIIIISKNVTFLIKYLLVI